MKAGLLVFGGVMVLLLALGGCGVMMYFNYDGQEIQLRNAVKAQQKSNEVSFDNTWKIIQQKCQLKDDYKETFKSFYPELMKGRHYEAGGNFMKWITESNPTFDVSLWKDIMNTIEAERKTFERNQNKLIALKQEHDNVRTIAPGRFFVGGRPEIEIAIVTSTKTEATFKSGKEDDIDLSPKKPEQAEKK
jgi:hypothetical protein